MSGFIFHCISISILNWNKNVREIVCFGFQFRFAWVGMVRTIAYIHACIKNIQLMQMTQLDTHKFNFSNSNACIWLCVSLQMKSISLNYVIMHLDMFDDLLETMIHLVVCVYFHLDIIYNDRKRKTKWTVNKGVKCNDASIHITTSGHTKSHRRQRNQTENMQIHFVFFKLHFINWKIQFNKKCFQIDYRR